MNKTITLFHQYGGVRPGDYRLVGQGYDYYEIKWRGTNICILKTFFEDDNGHQYR